MNISQLIPSCFKGIVELANYDGTVSFVSVVYKWIDENTIYCTDDKNMIYYVSPLSLVACK